MTFLAGCLGSDEPVVEYVNVVPDVPEIYRTPVDVPDRNGSGLKSVGALIADLVEAVEVANGRIIGADCILDAAESGNIAGDCK